MRLAQQSPASAVPGKPSTQTGFLAPQTGFAAATTAARGLMASAGYENIVFGRGVEKRSDAGAGVRGRIDTGTLAQLETLMLVLCVILNQQQSPEWLNRPAAITQATRAYHEQMADWFERCAAWVGSGTGGDTLAAEIPLPPTGVGQAWYGVLDRELRTIMSQIMHRANRNA
jgi:hypothetical protein